ncbi:response regulator [Sphingomonas sp. MMS12-HWE2-04]|uniref:response regulator n=1 Tax=Sphingomonas sp. MMS12-HWE2-04 TaxID=3234199 RepID=UPI00384E52D2
MLAALTVTWANTSSVDAVPWLGVAEHAALALAFFSMSLALTLVVYRRNDLYFGRTFLCLKLFLLACAVSAGLAIAAPWYPLTKAAAVVDALAALCGIGAAVILWRLLPKALSIPSPERLQATNAELSALIAQRDAALAELRGQVAEREFADAKREEAEAALVQSQKLEAVGQLTGGIAHDFNNLLQAVAGNLELIAHKPHDLDKVVGWSASALDAVQRGRAVTGQLLAFSRKQRLEVTSVRLTELVGGVKDLIEKAVAPLVQVRMEPIDAGWNVDADPLQLELAILSVAVNARDAMPNGGEVTLAAEKRTGLVSPDLPAGDYIALTISDTGTGMSPEVAARAVEPFFTTKEAGKGAGMGLSMAFGIMRQSGGALMIASEEGAGTAVTLLLRVAKAEPRRAAVDDGERDVRFDLRGCTVLLVEDDLQVRATLAETLRNAGAELHEAASGPEAMDMICTAKPHLLIVDLAMPGMNGTELAERARAKDPRLPVLVVTGLADATTRERLHAIDVELLLKPFDGHDLLRRVDMLKQRRALG